MRDHPLVSGQTYHVFSRSIAGYVIFNDSDEYNRFIEVMNYYVKERPSLRYSQYTNLSEEYQSNLKELHATQKDLVDIIAFCVMPTHVHFILKQLEKGGITQYMKNVKNSYTRYFNTKHKRKGPLWDSRFKNVLVKDNEYMLHLTRYVHLNPVTSSLVAKPEEWAYSSYQEYQKPDNRVFTEYISITHDKYKEFVEDRIEYQKELHKIQSLLLE